MLKYQNKYGLNEVKLGVGYGTGEMVLEIVRKWEYSPSNEDFEYWATISEIKLKLDDEIVKDSNNQAIEGYIIEPAGANPNIDKSADEQQKTSGSDTRIPAGEYEMFWKYSGKQVYARSAIDLEFIDLLKLNGVCSKNDVRDFSINPHSVNKGKNQLYDSQRQKHYKVRPIILRSNTIGICILT